ncbi:MAG: RING-H2 finger protein [Rhodothermaceae bacterium TMED105]|nr:MAG: RING-H2 finger protein [Rhodothermaceae bacterium TMED105]
MDKLKMEPSEVCVVCLSELEENVAQMPGCGHKFHVCCLINVVQYDTRCPVCRQIGEGVVSRQPDMVITTSSISTGTADFMTDVDSEYERVWRRYAARRRRLLRQRHDLKHEMETLKSIRNDMRQNMNDLEKAYQRGCKTVWRTDTDVVTHKKKLSTLRRKELRLSRKLSDQLETILGPEP